VVLGSSLRMSYIIINVSCTYFMECIKTFISSFIQVLTLVHIREIQSLVSKFRNETSGATFFDGNQTNYHEVLPFSSVGQREKRGQCPPPPKLLSSLGAFKKLRKGTISFVMSVRPPFCPHGRTLLPLDGCS